MSPTNTDSATPSSGDASSLASLDKLRAAHQRLRTELSNVIVGQHEVVDQLLLAILCRGHCLLEGVPGLAKTLMISSLARTLELSFNRIQFTPDLMPSDITGADLFHIDPESGQRSFRFAKGPLFANVVLADEINRTPPKTQAALLESMVERQVTAGGTRHELPDPFFVLATQNPIEQEGTYQLPEAQLDRFMFMIRVPYPTKDEEREILRRTTGNAIGELTAVLTRDELLELQRAVREIPVGDHVLDYVLALTRGTRVRSDEPLEFLREWVSWGAGPRASQFLVVGAKAHAAIAGRDHVAVEDVRAVVKPVLRHRIVTTFAAGAEGITSDSLLDRLVQEVDPEAVVSGTAGVRAS
jgi:MoxR-like ATPase